MDKNNLKALTPQQAVKIYPVLSIGTLANWRNQNRGPQFFKVGRSVCYRPEDIEKFIFQNPVLTRDCIDRD